MLKRLIGLALALVFLGLIGAGLFLVSVSASLPKLITVKDYEPLLVSEVYDRNGKKVGEFFREKRTLTPLEKVPKVLINAFIAAEDDTFYKHGGFNVLAMLRATFANIKAGAKVQGASTITQQTAKTLLLTGEKTFLRKIKELLLAYKMEQNLTKDEILYLYLNQIYLGQGAHGIEQAVQSFYRKPLKDVTLAEAAILAGMPKAPSAYSPIHNPERAKERQIYVLRRMVDEKMVTDDAAAKAAAEPVKVYTREKFEQVAPYFLETVRQMLVEKLGEEMVLDKGIKIYTTVDAKKQIEAQKQVQLGLREVDKREGYRGPKKNLADPNEVATFLVGTRNRLLDDAQDYRILTPDGKPQERKPLNLTGKTSDGKPMPNLPDYIKPDTITEAIVMDVNDKLGLVTVRFAESRGLIDLEDMKWARQPNPEVSAQFAEITKPSAALKKFDVIDIKVLGDKFYSERLNKMLADQKKAQGKKYQPPANLPKFEEYAKVSLEQEPEVQGALLSLDNKTGDLLAMVGGYDFEKTKLNRTFQAQRQTGSSFKVFVYTAALDKGFTPGTQILDAPVVFEEEGQDASGVDAKGKPQDEKPDPKKKDKKAAVDKKDKGRDPTKKGEEEEDKRWKPGNYSEKFVGDILFRNALIRSLNIPTVKITEKIGLEWASMYARRLGVFSPLNMDFTLALGSSGTTLYEMTKAFSIISRLGKMVRPLMVYKVVDRAGNVLAENLSLDDRFRNELEVLQKEFEEYRKGYLEYKKRVAAGEDEAKVKADIKTKLSEAGIKQYLDISKHPPIYFEDKDQLLSPQTSYVITNILQGVVDEPNGTGGAARSIGRPVAAKTGTTSGYYDAWFMGFTPDITTGVWVGHDHEKTLGRGETGGKTALPIWLEYMKAAHADLPARSFSAPEGIVFMNIDNDTGRLATAKAKNVVRQAFIEGTEPTAQDEKAKSLEDDQNFYKQDLTQ